MPENGIPETLTAKKRVRTGCLTCRRRRRKCDEGKPSCLNCQNKRFRCRYGVNLTFLPDNASSLNSEDIRSFPSPTPYPEIKFVTSFEDSPGMNSLNESSISRNDGGDSPATIESGHDFQGMFPGSSNSRDGSAYEPAPISPEAYNYSAGQLNFSAANAYNSRSRYSPQSPSSALAAQEDGDTEVNERDESNVPYGFASLRMDTDNPNHQANVASNEVANPSTRDTHTSSIGEKELQLLKYYRYEVAPWLDICDLYQRFGLDLLITGKTHRPLNDALFAISSRRQELLKGLPITETSDSTLYARSSEALLTLDLQSHDQNATYTYTILKFMDLMSAEPQDWTQHMQNISPCLLDSLRFQAFSERLMQSGFWNYVRLDIGAALVGGGNTILPVCQWFPRGMKLEATHQIFMLRRGMDDWAKYSMVLCAQAIDLRSERNVFGARGSITQPDYASRWNEIWNKTQAWYRDRPIELVPVFEAQADSLEDCSANVFPTSIFSTGCAILANQLHHTTTLLLLQCKPRTLRLSSGKTSQVWHAQKICGISAANELSRTWDFILLASLLIAARVMTHSSQHTVIIETLERVRILTAWRIGSEIYRLRAFWNLGSQGVT